MSAVGVALSGSTVSLCPRLCLCLQVQLRVLNFLKAALALVDHFVQDAHACIQIRMPDPVGVKRVELINLRHAS